MPPHKLSVSALLALLAVGTTQADPLSETNLRCAEGTWQLSEVRMLALETGSETQAAQMQQTVQALIRDGKFAMALVVDPVGAVTMTSTSSTRVNDTAAQNTERFAGKISFQTASARSARGGADAIDLWNKARSVRLLPRHNAIVAARWTCGAGYQPDKRSTGRDPAESLDSEYLFVRTGEVPSGCEVLNAGRASKAAAPAHDGLPDADAYQAVQLLDGFGAIFIGFAEPVLSPIEMTKECKASGHTTAQSIGCGFLGLLGSPFLAIRDWLLGSGDLVTGGYYKLSRKMGVFDYFSDKPERTAP